VTDAHVVILHAIPATDAGPLTQAVGAARAALAERHREQFTLAGAASVRIMAGPPDDVSFGARLRAIARGLGPGGLVVLGSGAVPLLRAADAARFLAVAARDDRVALANNRYSADIVAVARAREVLAGLPPDLATDNALPRWLAASADVDVSDLRDRWRLGVDIDSPLDLVVLGPRFARHLDPDHREVAEARLEAIRVIASNVGAELLVAGRTSAAALAWLEVTTAARTRALVEERGLRTSVNGQRPPASVLGLLLERDGPASLGTHLARLADAALVDSRVLLAHRLGPDETSWPTPEDRFASDLLLPARVDDPWLRELTAAAAAAPIPIVLGGHTLVGPGLRLALRIAPRPTA